MPTPRRPNRVLIRCADAERERNAGRVRDAGRDFERFARGGLAFRLIVMVIEMLFDHGLPGVVASAPGLVAVRSVVAVMPTGGPVAPAMMIPVGSPVMPRSSVVLAVVPGTIVVLTVVPGTILVLAQMVVARRQPAPSDVFAVTAVLPPVSAARGP